MKLVTRIYLYLGLILLTFALVTLMYVRQSDNVEADVKEALRATEVQTLAEGLEKAIIDTETGLRGFQVGSDEMFLEPYHSGRKEYAKKLSKLYKLVKDKQQEKLLLSVDSTYQHWLQDFAEPSIRLQREAVRSEAGRVAYEQFRTEYIVTGAGKNIIDKIRSQIALFEVREKEIREQFLLDLNQTMVFTDDLAISLTFFCIMLGTIVALYLGGTIKKRLEEIATVAGEVAEGHFNVHVTDNKNDEISKVSHSLNVMTNKLNNSFSNLQKMNKELDQFAYVVSHDLKAPLRAINSLAEWIQEDLPNADPDTKRNLDLMQGRVKRMGSLIDGILEYSRIGRKELPKVTFSVAGLLEEISDSIAATTNATINIPDRLPTVTTERILLEQVFSNLISNAVKYNDKPQPVVTVGYREHAAFHEFYVEDNGLGIPEAFHDKIFGVFQTIEARDTKESTGIGLAIVKKIVEEKGGTVTVTSEEAKGSRFTFLWPKPQTEAVAQQYTYPSTLKV